MYYIKNTFYTETLEIIDKITLNFTLVSKHSKKHIVQNHHNFQTLLNTITTV